MYLFLVNQTILFYLQNNIIRVSSLFFFKQMRMPMLLRYNQHLQWIVDNKQYHCSHKLLRAHKTRNNTSSIEANRNAEINRDTRTMAQTNVKKTRLVHSISCKSSIEGNCLAMCPGNRFPQLQTLSENFHFVFFLRTRLFLLFLETCSFALVFLRGTEITF